MTQFFGQNSHALGSEEEVNERGRKRQMGVVKRYRDFCSLYLLDFLRYLDRIVVQAVVVLDKQILYIESVKGHNLPDIPHHKN